MRRTNKSGVTLIEIILVVLLIFLFVTGSITGGREYGILGYLLGGLVFVASFFLFVLFVGLIEGLAVGGIPRIPVCRQGKCRKGDYSPVKITERRWAVRCKCGDIYDKVGRRFVSLTKEGVETPYLKWIPFMGWKKEAPTTDSTVPSEGAPSDVQ